MIEDYTIIGTSVSVQVLEVLVYEAIADGWQPIGGVATDVVLDGFEGLEVNRSYYQAMVKYG